MPLKSYEHCCSTMQAMASLGKIEGVIPVLHAPQPCIYQIQIGTMCCRPSRLLTMGTVIERGEIIFVTDRVCEILGRSREEVFNMEPFEFTDKDENLRLRLMIHESRKTGYLPSEEKYWIKRKDGTRRLIHNRYIIKRWEEGLVDRYIITTDITDDNF